MCCGDLRTLVTFLGFLRGQPLVAFKLRFQSVGFLDMFGRPAPLPRFFGKILQGSSLPLRFITHSAQKVVKSSASPSQGRCGTWRDGTSQGLLQTRHRITAPSRRSLMWALTDVGAQRSCLLSLPRELESLCGILPLAAGRLLGMKVCLC